MLDAGGEHGAARGPPAEVAMGLSGVGARPRAQAQHAHRLIGQPRLPGADDHQQVARLIGVNHRREHRHADRRRDRRRRQRIARDHVARHRVAQHRQPPVHAGQRAGEIGDAAQFRHQRGGRAVLGRHVAGHRARIAAMAEKIERHRHIAVPRQRGRERAHQRTRAGEPVRDHHGGRGRLGCGPGDGDGRGADGGGLDPQPRIGAHQLPQRQRDGANGGERNSDSRRADRMDRLLCDPGYVHCGCSCTG